MALDFPTSPTIGTTTSAGNKTWKWNGEGWELVPNIVVGEKGNIGAQGGQGIQGLQGLQGSQGVQNAQGTQGLQGVQGPLGIGSPGSQGSQGSQGLQGLQGSQGVQNAQGLQGRQGTQGAAGFQGSQAAQGLQGRQGLQGTQGVQGISNTGSSSYSLLDLAVPENLTIGTGTVLTTITNVINMNTKTEVPTQTNIAIFGTSYASTPTGTRFVQNKTRSYLASTGFVYFYVNKAGTWGDSPDGYQNDNLLLQYSVNGSTWTTWTTLSPDDYSENVWTQVSVRVPDAAKYYSGVYVRFYQSTYQSQDDNWAVTSIVPEGASAAGGGGSGGGNGNLIIAAMNLSNPTLFTIGAGANLTEVGGYSGISSSTQVPSSTDICVFTGSTAGTRTLTNYSKIYLSTVDYLYYYVNMGGGGWGDIPEYYQNDDLIFEYSVDGSTWYNLDTVNAIDITSSNVWTQRTITIPAGAKYYSGVYLKVRQSTFYSTSDNWAFTSLLASFGGGGGSNTSDIGAAGNLTVSLLNFTNTLTLSLGNGTRMTTVGSYAGISSSTKVPSSSSIGVFDGYLSLYGNGTRLVQNLSKVYLTTIDYIYYYVNMGGGGWGDIPEYYENNDLLVDYSIDGVSWTNLDTVNALTLTSNVWTLRTIIIPDVAKNFSGVYLRIRQTSYYYDDDNWAFTTLVGGFGQPGNTSTSSSSGNLILSLMNFTNSNTLSLGDGTRLTSVGSFSGISSSITTVPTGTPITVFDGYLSLYSNGERRIENNTRVYLTATDFLYYYVNMGGGAWGDIPEYYENNNLLVDYSVNGVSWTNLDTVNAIDIASLNVWTLRTIRLPAEAKNFSGVYLRIRQTSYYYGSDNWAFTTLMPGFGQPGGNANNTGSLNTVLLNLTETNNITVSNGTTLSSVGSYSGISTSIPVPTGTAIAVFDGALSVYSNGSRSVYTTQKVYLNGINGIKFYVNEGGAWLSSPDSGDNLLLQYSTNASSWTTFKTILPADLTTNVWTSITADIPAEAKLVSGVYLQVAQTSYYYGQDNWAFTSIFANFSANSLVNNSKSTSYTLTAEDVGELINISTGGVTVPSGIFNAGESITIYNNSSSSQTITQGSSVTMYLAGSATTGNRTLAQRGVCTVLCVASNTFTIYGAGLT